MDIIELLKEATKETLSEENLNKISEAIELKADEIAKDKYELKLESALAKQDTEYADKLETFLEDIDKDHSEKLETLIEGMDKKHVDMLQNVIKKYKNEYLTECETFKEGLVKKIDAFFDLVVEEQIPQKELKEAVENIRYKKIVEDISKMIGFDKLQQNSLVKEGLMDAKTQIDSLNEELETLKTERSKILTEKLDAKRSKLLAEKTQGLPKIKKQYIQKVLGNKSIEFITENFEYTLELFDEEEISNTEVLKEQATQQSKVISEKVDRVDTTTEQLKEKPSKVADMYMTELSQM